MPALHDITGVQFGRLLALHRGPNNKSGKPTWVCQCSCGNRKTISKQHLVRGDTQSCGCLLHEIISQGDDISGQKFGRLTAIRCSDERDSAGRRLWLCRCDCSASSLVSVGGLRSGQSKSCGCLKLETITNLNLRHGMTNTQINYVWRGMKQRCTNLNNISYKNYGGRGIYVCERWMNSFEAFLEDMGPRPEGFWIDRIDNDGPYSPENCKWSSYEEQMKNKRPRSDRPKKAA